ncbi:MAG: hypothetical protein ACRDXX_17555 [Stackebrandtia sp.]
MSDHILIRRGALADMITELSRATPCDGCTGEPAIRIEGDEEWELVAVHDVACPSSNRSQRLRRDAPARRRREG